MNFLLIALIFSGALFMGGCSTPANDGQELSESLISERLDMPIGWEAQDEIDKFKQAVLADGHLMIEEAVRLALINNHGLRAEIQGIDVAYADIIKAIVVPNPVLDMEALFVEAGKGEMLEFVGTQSVIDILLIPIRKQVAEEQYQEAVYTVSAIALDLVAETRTAYRQYQAQLELINLFQSATDATYLGYEASERLYEAGNIINLDVLTQRTLYEETKIGLTQAMTQAQSIRENLNQLMGLWQDDSNMWEVEPRLPVPPAIEVESEALEQEAIGNSLELTAARHNLIEFGHKLKLEPVEETFEHFSLGGRIEKEPDGTWMGGPVLGLSIPLFNFGQGESIEAKALFEQAYKQYTNLALRIRHRARSAYYQTSTSLENSRYWLDVILPLRSQITEQTQRQFNAMQIGVFQLLDAKRRKIEAGRQYVQSLRDHWISRIDLETILSGRMPQMRFGIEIGGGGGVGAMIGGNGGGGH